MDVGYIQGRLVFMIEKGLSLVYIHSVKVVVVLVISYLFLVGIHITLIAKYKRVLTSFKRRDLLTPGDLLSLHGRLICRSGVFI